MQSDAISDQEAIDAVRREARLESLRAIRKLEDAIRADEGMGGIDSIRLGALCQQVKEKVRVYGMTVSAGDDPLSRAAMADLDAIWVGLSLRRR